MLTENSLVRKTVFNDGLFLKRLYRVTTKEEIDSIINILDKSSLSYRDHRDIKDFFTKIRFQFDSWFDTVLGMTEHFDLDDNIFKSTFITLQLKIEQGLCVEVEQRELEQRELEEKERKRKGQHKNDNPSIRLQKKRASALKYYYRHKAEILKRRKKASTK